jgi:hypothetical protein
LRNVVSFTPKRRATDARESSLDNANATASRRKASGYFDGRPIRDPFPWPHARIRCPPKRVNSNHPERSHLHQTSPQRSHRSTDQALSERLSFVTAGEQITDIVKILLNC